MGSIEFTHQQLNITRKNQIEHENSRNKLKFKPATRNLKENLEPVQGKR